MACSMVLQNSGSLRGLSENPRVASARTKFIVPAGLSTDDNILLKHPRDKLVVVSIIGKSSYNDNGCKASVANDMIGRHIFKMGNPPSIDKETLNLIEGYYDRPSRVVYLHLRSTEDGYHLHELLKTEKSSGIKKNFHVRYAEYRYQYARALLVLFSVSHIVLFVRPTPILDDLDIQMFRILDNNRQKAGALLSELLRDIPGISKEWINQLRPCTPRLLFLFDTCLDEVYNEEMGNEPTKNSQSSIKRFEHGLEDRFYRVLRKRRIITNSSSNSLFAIPANQEFVFCKLQTQQMKDRTANMVNSLVDFCLGNEKPKTTVSTLLPIDEPHDFIPFLQQHIDLALNKGFDDSVGRHGNSAHFELPTAATWSQACRKVYSFFLESPTEMKHKQLLSNLYSCFDASVQFSEARCKKVLPLATAAYQDNLPAHYTKTYHEGKLAHAVSVLVQHARGPSCSKYIEQLRQECDRHWKAGRQMCEVLSLTGNPCTNPLHRAIEEEEPCKEALTRDRVPTMPHSSGVRYVSACNCGRKQGPREDPFVLRTANCDFYAVLAVDCCESLEQRAFPVFQPSVKDFRAARLLPKAADNIVGSRRESLRSDSNVGTTQGNTQQGLSLGTFFSGHSGESEMGAEEISRLSSQILRTKEENNFSNSQQEIVIKVTDSDREFNKEKGLVRQPSTTEYLPGMPHTESPPGLLPQFPSWSLVCLGPSSLYSHNHGLTDQPNFLPGTGYLLPWDVTVRLEPSTDQTTGTNEIRWPLLGDSAYSPAQPRKQMHTKGRKSKPGQDQSEFVVKIFIGTEYECPRGHRFMCSAPDRVLKATVSGLVKETGLKVAASDMPLYFPCPCRSAKPLTAQLMRIHVVTPKARVHVTLFPKVQPAPEPCPIFIPGFQEPIKLSQSAYWVLRLPYIYVGEQGPYPLLKEHAPTTYGRLLAGTYGISHY